MSTRFDQVAHRMRSLVLLGMVLSILVACGGPEPTAQVVVVTSTFTPTPVVQVVTATFTPTLAATDTPEPTETTVPTDTPLPPPTDTPLPPTDESPAEPELEFFSYEHPSGAFSVDIPTNADYDDDNESLYFTYGDSLMMIFYTILDQSIDAETLESIVPLVLDESLVGEGLITSYSNVETEMNEAGNMIAANFDATSDEYSEGEGILVLWQLGRTLYFVILLTPDYGSIQEVWETAFNSLTANAMEADEPTAVPSPTATKKAAPTPTKKAAPTPTKKPAPPPPSANKGCYLLDNQLGADITITFTAQDRQWNDTVTLPKNTQKEYCLDPGLYTYTLDAPPPWGSTNGDLQVNAGDRFHWPISGG